MTIRASPPYERGLLTSEALPCGYPPGIRTPILAFKVLCPAVEREGIMECDCWWPFFRGMGFGIALILTPSLLALALLLSKAPGPDDDDDGPTRGT